MLELRVDKYLTHVTPLLFQPSQPVNIFAGFVFTFIGNDTLQYGVVFIWTDIWTDKTKTYVPGLGLQD